MKKLLLAFALCAVVVPSFAQQAIQYKTGTCTSTAPAITTGSTTILAADRLRKVLVIQNKHATAKVYIDFGATASSADYLVAPLGGVFRMDNIVSNQAINAIGDAANTEVTVISCD